MFYFVGVLPFMSCNRKKQLINTQKSRCLFNDIRRLPNLPILCCAYVALIVWNISRYTTRKHWTTRIFITKVISSDWAFQRSTEKHFNTQLLAWLWSLLNASCSFLKLSAMLATVCSSSVTLSARPKSFCSNGWLIDPWFSSAGCDTAGPSSS